MSDAQSELSKTQVDRLGDRLRAGSLSDADLRLLDSYRRSFSEAYEQVVRAIREKLALEPTGRPAKSTSSIIEKLQRETIRLTQIQDIAGCRVVVESVADQDEVVSATRTLFTDLSVVDRRKTPRFGYRAVHVVVEIEGKLVEIQIRTALQHLWAEISERLSDTVDPTLKYGGGPQESRRLLDAASREVAIAERLEPLLAKTAEFSAEQLSGHESMLADARQRLKATRQLLSGLLADLASEDK